MQTATSLQSCLHCELSFPVSRLPHHIREAHDDHKVIKSDNGATQTKEEKMEEESDEDYYDESMEDLEEDMDLDINDDDINDFLKNREESKQFEASEDNKVSNTQQESVEESETVPCAICKLSLKKPDLSTHLALKHDIVMETDIKDDNKVLEPPPVPEDDQLDESMEEDLVLKETCEMCDERIGIKIMVSHLAEVHSVRVILDPNRSLDSSLNSSLNSSLDSTTNEDPFDLPDFLKKDLNSDIVKFKCHHCQKAFLSVDKLDKHTAKKHEKKCKICHIQKLVQENRYITILKQLRNTKVGDKQEIPSNNSFTTGELLNKVFSYEELYPEMPPSCEECEDFFYWPDSSHSCPLVTQNIRVLCGAKVSRGRMMTGELESSGTEGGEFDYISGTLAQSMVKKMSLELVTANCSDVLDDVLESVITGNFKLGVKTEKTNLQKEALVLVKKYEDKGKKVPDILNRAAKESEFEGESGNVLRKLLGVFVEEYKEDIEEQNKKMFNDRVDERKRIQEEARKEMNQSKYYDYSKYAIPNLKAMKKSKPLFPLQKLNSSLNSSVTSNVVDNPMGLPSGGTALEATGSTTFLNKLRRQQNRTIKVYNNKRSLLRTKPNPVPGPPGPTNYSSPGQAPDSLPSPSLSMQAAPSLARKMPSVLNSSSLSIKIEPGTLSSASSAQVPKSAATAPLAPQSPGLNLPTRVQQPTVPGATQLKSIIKSQQPGTETAAPSTISQSKNSAKALERLQSLGLSVTVKEKERLPLQNSRPQNILPKAPLNKGLSVKERERLPLQNSRLQNILPKSQVNIQQKVAIPRVGQPASMKVKVLTKTQNTIFKNQGTRRTLPSPQTMPLSATSKPVVCSPIPTNTTLSTSVISREKVQNQTPTQANLPTNPSQLKTYLNRRKEEIKKSSPITKEITTKQVSTLNRSSLGAGNLSGKQKVEFDERQKLMIKSQMLAYRMLRRKERLPEVVFNAATNKNFRNSTSHSKTDLSHLSSLFKKEYSNLKR